MKVCFQRSDTSCKDFVFDTIDEVLDYWNNIDKAREDAFCGDQEDCPWCLYIEDEITFHIFRYDELKDTFGIRVWKEVKYKLLGFIPMSKEIDKNIEEVPAGEVEKYFRWYDKDPESFFNTTP